jgi:hypothetical protein
VVAVVNRIELKRLIDDDPAQRDLPDRVSQIAGGLCALLAANWVPRPYARHRPAEIET